MPCAVGPPYWQICRRVNRQPSGASCARARTSTVASSRGELAFRGDRPPLVVEQLDGLDRREPLGASVPPDDERGACSKDRRRVRGA